MKKIYATEEEEQCALIQWADNHPRIKGLLVHVPNGGYRTKTEAARFKKMGVRKGFPDLFLPITTFHFCGLFIEMKRRRLSTTSITMFQHAWLDDLNEEGYLAIVCYGWEEAKDAIEKYLKYI